MAQKNIFKFSVIAAAILCACASSFATDSADRTGGNKDIPGLPEREKLIYKITWFGIPVGTATACINGIKKINGRYAYELVITAGTNAFCSRIYKVEDRYVSYMDTEELYTLRHEVYRREGRYKKDAITDFDHIKHKAYYRHLPGGSEKIVDIPPGVQDPVSMAYYFRLVPLRVGDMKKFFVYNNESVYQLYGMVDKKVVRKFPYPGVQEAFHLQPYARLNGELVRKGTAHGYFSCGNRQLPLLAIVKGPVFTRVIGYLAGEEKPAGIKES